MRSHEVALEEPQIYMSRSLVSVKDVKTYSAGDTAGSKKRLERNGRALRNFIAVARISVWSRKTWAAAENNMMGDSALVLYI
jgi:hypothetical protein